MAVVDNGIIENDNGIMANDNGSDALKLIVLDYLRGEAVNVIKVRLQTECVDIRCKDLYKSVRLTNSDENEENPADDTYMDAILNCLNISKQNYPEILEQLQPANLYNLLTYLYHHGNHHAGHLLSLIENTKPSANWTTTFLLGAFFSASLALIYQLNQDFFETVGRWLQRTFPFVIDWIGQTFSLLRNVPLLGIISNGIGLVINWYQTFTNGITPTALKLDRLIFKTLTAGLTIAAYTLSYLAEGAMAATAAILFVLSSSVDLFKSLYIFFKDKYALSELGEEAPAKDASPEIQAQYARAQDLYDSSLKSVWVRLGAALVSTAAVAVWSFFPPNFVITFTCLTLITLTSLAKRSILASMSESQAQALQKTIGQIYRTDPKHNLAQRATIEQVKLKQKELDNREHRLVEREKSLTETKTVIEENLAHLADNLQQQSALEEEREKLVHDNKKTMFSFTTILNELQKQNNQGLPVNKASIANIGVQCPVANEDDVSADASRSPSVSNLSFLTNIHASGSNKQQEVEPFSPLSPADSPTDTQSQP